MKQPTTYLHEGAGMIQRGQSSFYANGSTPYHEPKPELFRGMPQASHVFHDVIPSDNGALGSQMGRPLHGDTREYDRQVLADHLSQQLLRDHIKQNLSIEFKPSSLVLGRSNGF
jgi:hypothetical protein